MKRLDVQFQSEGATVRAWFYKAEGGGRRPTVVLAGGWCYVREIVMPTYAKAFAEAGINAMIFDYRNLGVSDGDIRQHLDPWGQIRDYQNAISFLEGRDDVDSNRIGVWGISYSGGHALILAAIDPRVKSIVSQIPVIEQAIETAALMLGTDKSRGYCLETICADFLAGANLGNQNPEALLYSMTRFFSLAIHRWLLRINSATV